MCTKRMTNPIKQTAALKTALLLMRLIILQNEPDCYESTEFLVVCDSGNVYLEHHALDILLKKRKVLLPLRCGGANPFRGARIEIGRIQIDKDESPLRHLPLMQANHGPMLGSTPSAAASLAALEASRRTFMRESQTASREP